MNHFWLRTYYIFTITPIDLIFKEWYKEFSKQISSSAQSLIENARAIFLNLRSSCPYTFNFSLCNQKNWVKKADRLVSVFQMPFQNNNTESKWSNGNITRRLLSLNERPDGCHKSTNLIYKCLMHRIIRISCNKIRSEIANNNFMGIPFVL